MAANDDSWTNEAADAATEAAAILHLLYVHPAQLTIAELIRELGGEAPGFAERDAIERAARDLVAVGLLHRHDDLLTPTRAALRLSELLDR
jgi:DNA-binding IclR family transcriptional regulator